MSPHCSSSDSKKSNNLSTILNCKLLSCISQNSEIGDRSSFAGYLPYYTVSQAGQKLAQLVGPLRPAMQAVPRHFSSHVTTSGLRCNLSEAAMGVEAERRIPMEDSASRSQAVVGGELQVSLCLLDSEEGAETQQETRGDLPWLLMEGVVVTGGETEGVLRAGWLLQAWQPTWGSHSLCNYMLRVLLCKRHRGSGIWLWSRS